MKIMHFFKKSNILLKMGKIKQETDQDMVAYSNKQQLFSNNSKALIHHEVFTALAL
jgi:hypothetical protein